MLHDYHHIVYKAACNLHTKWTCDLIYYNEIKRMQIEGIKKWRIKWVAISRFTLLKTFGIPFLIYSRITKGKPRDQQKRRLYSDYIILTKN